MAHLAASAIEDGQLLAGYRHPAEALLAKRDVPGRSLPAMQCRPLAVPRWVLRGALRTFALALVLLPRLALPADYYYPEYKKNPVPPVAVVEDVVVDDVGAHPACNPANEACEDPEAASALAEAPDPISPSSPLARTD